MKILFIHPPCADVYAGYKDAAKLGVQYPPLGICYLAAIAKRLGHICKIIDAEPAGYTYDDIVRIAEEFEPDIIGITSTTPIFNQAVATAKALKEKLNVPILIGGSHISVVPEDTFRYANTFDIGVIGEGEKTFVELLEYFEGKRKINEIKGIIYKEQDKIIMTEPRPMLRPEELDELPLPERKLLDLEK